MPTRSDIIVQRADGKWARIYCHSDGYLSHNGKILFEHYTDQKKVDRLVALGDLSWLGPEIGRKIDFDITMKLYSLYRDGKLSEAEYDKRRDAANGQCRAYGRDRGEKGTSATVCDTLAQVWPEQDTWTEFTYVWRRDARGEGKWWVGDPDEGSQTLVDLGEALLGKKLVTPAVKVPFVGTIGRHGPHDPTA